MIGVAFSLKSIGCGLLTFENKHSPSRKERVAYAIGKQKKNAMNEIPSLMITHETISGVRTTEKVAFPPPSLISWNTNNQTSKYLEAPPCKWYAWKC